MPTQCWDCARLGGCTRPDHGATGCGAFVRSQLTHADIAWILGLAPGSISHIVERRGEWDVADRLAERGVRAIPEKRKRKTLFFQKCP